MGLLSASCCNRCKVDNACLKSGLCVNGIVLEPCLFEKPPFALIERVLLCGQMVSVIFIRKSIPLSTKFLVSMFFNHSTTEFWISYESDMDSLEILFLASFLQLVSRKIFLVSLLFTMSMSMRSSFLDDGLRN